MRCRWQMKRNRTSGSGRKNQGKRKPADFFGHRNRGRLGPPPVAEKGSKKEWQRSQRATERRRGQTDAGTATGICSHTLSVPIPVQPVFVTEIDAGHETPDAARHPVFFEPFFRVKIKRWMGYCKFIFMMI